MNAALYLWVPLAMVFVCFESVDGGKTGITRCENSRKRVGRIKRRQTSRPPFCGSRSPNERNGDDRMKCRPPVREEEGGRRAPRDPSSSYFLKKKIPSVSNPPRFHVYTSALPPSPPCHLTQNCVHFAQYTLVHTYTLVI